MFSNKLIFGSKIAGHSQEINSIFFAPKKKLLASASGELISTITHEREISVVAFSPNNKILATGCERGNISLFKPQSKSQNLLQDLLV